MAVKLTSEIQIGGFKFSGVHSLKIHKSMHDYVTQAYLQIPHKCRVQTANGTQDKGIVLTGDQFKDGDPVIIKLGYDGNNNQEFKGFVRRRNFNKPLEIEMEGYSYILKRKKFNGINKNKITVKELLQLVVADTDITIRCDVDMTLTGVVIKAGGRIAILDYLKEKLHDTLSIFFINDTELYCGLLNLAYQQGKDPISIGGAKYRLGYNCLKENSLKKRTTSQNPVIINGLSRTAKGEAVEAKSKGVANIDNRVKKLLYNNIKDSEILKDLTTEKQWKMNYDGYEGSFEGFGVPFVQPAYIVTVLDTDNKDMNGDYVADGIEVYFGINGFRRHISVAHRVSIQRE